MEIVGELIGLDPDEARLDAGHGAIEFLCAHIAELIREVALQVREVALPEGEAANDMVLPQARLGFMGAEAGASDRIESDEIRREGRAGIGGVDALLVEPMPDLVGRAEHGGRKIVPVVAGGDAHVVAGERHLERMHRRVEAPALEVVSELLGERQAEGALPLLRKVPEQEIGARPRPGPRGIEDRQQPVPQIPRTAP